MWGLDKETTVLDTGNTTGKEALEESNGKRRGWRLAEDFRFIQRAQKSHRKYWDRSTIQCHMEKELGARGVKAGDLHADS